MKSKEYLEFTQQDKEKGFIELEINFIKSKYNSHVSKQYKRLFKVLFLNSEATLVLITLKGFGL